MTEIKFYHNAPDRLKAACTITIKALAQGRKVIVYAPDETIARRYDHLLWTVQPTSFVPHVAQSSPLASRTHVVLATELSNTPHDDVLINLDGALPAEFARFHMLVEIVSRTEEERHNARDRWKFYKERGYPISPYDLANLK